MRKPQETYSDIRSAIAFIMRNERGLSIHTITEAALAATKVLHRNPAVRGQRSAVKAGGRRDA